MPKSYPEEFRQDVVRVARNGGPGVTVEQVAADFGVHAMTLWKWMRRADIDDGTKPGVTSQGNTELREARGALRESMAKTLISRRSLAAHCECARTFVLSARTYFLTCTTWPPLRVPNTPSTACDVQICVNGR
ncbi:transposase [Streptomyces sp. NBC_00063]|uniref:transposase n=1 Tax=Streptomyces sp. NBC_00063 TaxID=2975638 RepID=UPI003D72B382